VEVLLGRRNVCVTEPLLNDLEIGPAGEQPRGVRMPQIVEAHWRLYARSCARWSPNASTEPITGNVSVGLSQTRGTWRVESSGPPLRSIAREYAPAMAAAAPTGRIAAERAVTIAMAGWIRIGSSKVIAICRAVAWVVICELIEAEEQITSVQTRAPCKVQQTMHQRRL
jgi:hypothetical protein